jgi:hypothetical protein
MSIEVAVEAYEVAPMIARAQAAFRRDLPDLMKTHYRQWVAYHGEDRIRFGRTQFELYEECYRRGLHDDEFVVRSIEPEMPDEIDVTEVIDT